jgi:hypothetical protein
MFALYRLNINESTMTNRFRYYSIYAWGTALVATIIGWPLKLEGLYYVTNPFNTSCIYHGK